MSSTPDIYIPNPRKLRILQANVRFTAEAQSTLLQLAETSGYDIVLVQEPNTSLSATYNYTPTIRSYDVHSPVYAWSRHDTRPRVLTFVRKGIPFRVHPTEEFRDRRDILALRVGDIVMVNVYRSRTAGVFEALTNWTPPTQTIVAGDFNAGALMWQDCDARDGGAVLEAWADTHNLRGRGVGKGGGRQDDGVLRPWMGGWLVKSLKERRGQYSGHGYVIWSLRRQLSTEPFS
ncbi:hypothetical protein MY4038_003743 [Beauveria bassiana]